MTSIDKASWIEDYGTDLESHLEGQFRDGFRISVFKYPAETELAGSMIVGRCFVVAGVCRFIYRDAEVTLEPGEWAELPEGTYRMSVGYDDAKLYMVWRLPSE